MEQREPPFLAHRSEDGTRTQTAAEHLQGTAALAGRFAAEFGAAEQGRQAGKLHDIGKYSEAFQRRLLQNGPRTDHSTAGAQEAFFLLRQTSIAFAVAGHHSGLPDGGHCTDGADEPTLCGRMKKRVEPCSSWKGEITLSAAPLPPWAMCDRLTIAFYTRMLYSCLVDADFLDTEAFMDGCSPPHGGGESIPALLVRVRERAEHYLQAKSAAPVARQRNAVLRACMKCGAEGEQGLYTLTVPTGGGKTFASLAFAMEHAAARRLHRVIYVIPYTSIIDQTAQTFAELLGTENVLAHYSGAEYQQKDAENLTPQEYRQMLAAENWDAPVVVTTAVQFFESLYANRSSRCRKLHNIAGSVVVFDEAQTLPGSCLRPCVSAIGQLVQHYHTTAVLCTATQPALEPLFRELAPDLSAQEISPDPEGLYRTLRRTTLCDGGTLTDEALQGALAAMPQVLCVVNRRKTAQTLFAALPREGSYCLTTLLCAADRQAQLKEIRERLKEGLPCRVVSTSLIEAGVDVDFPTVYREQCGLDSLLQAAGRCNREGRRPAAQSRVVRFCLQDSPAPQMLRQGIGALEYTLRHHEDLNTPGAIHCYFHELFYRIQSRYALDQKGILAAFEEGIDGCEYPFAQVAERFRVIDAPTRTVYLPVGQGAALCEKLRRGYISRTLLRQLGIYGVCCYRQQFDALNDAGALECLPDGNAILRDTGCYNPHTGLSLDCETGLGIFV